MITSEKRRTRRSFGRLQQNRSKRWSASYVGPDGVLYYAPQGTFRTKAEAERWLNDIDSSIRKETWTVPGEVKAEPDSFRVYAAAWVAQRDIKLRTREHYETLLRLHILPAFGDVPIAKISPAMIRTWYARETGPTIKAHSYALMSSIMKTAVEDELAEKNPCLIHKGGTSKTKKKIRPLTIEEIEMLAKTVPERYSAMVLTMAWCSLRFGEAAALEIQDVDLERRVLIIRQGVVWSREHGKVLDTPKNAETAGTEVSIPKRIVEPLRAHLRNHAAETFVFPAAWSDTPLGASTFQKVFDRAAEKIGRPDATPHTLRHSGQTLAADAGADLRTLMARARQTSPSAALRYIHESEKRQQKLADALDEL